MKSTMLLLGMLAVLATATMAGMCDQRGQEATPPAEQSPPPPPPADPAQ
jgi:hypothetical protein